MSDDTARDRPSRRRAFVAIVGAAIVTACLSKLSRPRVTSSALSASAPELDRPIFGSLLEDKDAARPDRMAVYNSTCELLTIAGPLYARFSRPAPDVFALEGARALLARISSGRRIIRGHTLVWHRLQSDWMAALPSGRPALEAMQRHVDGVVRALRGLVHQWDVVNEPLDERSADPDRLRSSRWHHLLGRDYIAHALVAARQADPRAALGINENGLDADDARGRERRRAMLALLTRLRTEGHAPDYLGIQAHLDPGQRYSAGGVGAFILAVRDLGIDVHVTELDVSDVRLPADVRARDRAVSDVYDRYLRVVTGSRQVASICSWGLFDDTSWLQQEYPRSDGLPQRPLPFDAMGQSKPAWETIRRFAKVRGAA
jgi:endo-1,4-beta-xylanase